jgi:hypothetical protein
MGAAILAGISKLMKMDFPVWFIALNTSSIPIIYIARMLLLVQHAGLYVIMSGKPLQGSL